MSRDIATEELLCIARERRTRGAPKVKTFSPLNLSNVARCSCCSAGVAPYTQSGSGFDADAGQFEVLDRRPIEVVLGEGLPAGACIDGYEPAAPI